jgi:methylenetetrahydrofolate dehydrogenase (NAD+)
LTNEKMRVSPVGVAKPFREEIAEIISTKYPDKPPKLVGFLANKDPAAKKYAEWTGRACMEDNIAYELRDVDAMDLECALHEANRDPTVHGIIIYYPVFGADPCYYGGSMDDFLRDSIAPEKDVEGLCHLYRSNLYKDVRYMDERRRLKCVLPCTPLAVVKAIEAQGCYDEKLPVGRRLTGKVVTVVNRSEIVGRPLAALLANDGAVVYSIDINSVYKVRKGTMAKCEVSTEDACRMSHIVVLGVPAKDYKLDPGCIQPGSLVINVASFKNVDPDALSQIPDVKFMSAVGKVTVAMLERNLLRLYLNFHRGIVDSNDSLYEEGGGKADSTSKANSPPRGHLSDSVLSNLVVGAAVVSAVCSVLSLAIVASRR